MEKFKKKLVEMCKVNVKATVVFIILALFLALLGIGDSEGDVYLLAAGIFAFVAILDVWHSWNQEEAHQSPVEGNGGGESANPIQ